MSDLIKREDAIKAVSISCGTCLARDMEDCEKCSVPKLRELINAIPSADRPQGEWKDRTYGGRILHPWWESCECNQCEEWGSGAWNYCPHCGARMKGADDERESK